jgi:hypothetical protein
MLANVMIQRSHIDVMTGGGEMRSRLNKVGGIDNFYKKENNADLIRNYSNRFGTSPYSDNRKNPSSKKLQNCQ